MDTKHFEPIGEYNEILEIDNLERCISSASEITNVKIDISKLDYELLKKKRDFERKYQEILDYISQFWGKFICIKFYANINYTNTRETEPHWSDIYRAFVMPYLYVETNHQLFGLYCKLEEDYFGGIRDTSIDLFYMVQHHHTVIYEIDKEEFINEAKKSVDNVFESRCNKINSNDRVLTKNGYITNFNKL